MVMGDSAMRNDAGIATGVDRVYQSYNPYMQHHHLHHSPSHYGHYPHTYAHEYGHSSAPGSSSYYHSIGSALPQPASHPMYGKPLHHDGSDPKQFGLKYSGSEPNYSGTDYGHHNSHGKYKGKGGKTAALSALTLLAFLFFLNLLQSCLKEHMDTMNPTVMVMTATARRKVDTQTDVEYYDEGTYENNSDEESSVAVAREGGTNNKQRRRNNSTTTTTIAPKLKNIIRKDDKTFTNLHFNEK